MKQSILYLGCTGEVIPTQEFLDYYKKAVILVMERDEYLSPSQAQDIYRFLDEGKQL